MRILIFILLLFSLQAAGQNVKFKLSKYAKIKLIQGTLPEPPEEDTEDPTTPTLSFVSKTATSISVSWTTSTDNVAVTGYDVYLDGVFEDNEAGTTYTVIGLTASTEYDIYVVARDAAGNSSANSNTITQTTDSDPPPSGDEIFRIVTGGSGWEYLDPDTDVWTAMTLYDDPSLADGIANITSGSVTIKGKIFTNTGGTNSGRCITLNANNVTIKNCIIGNGNGIGVYVNNGVNDFLFQNNLIHNVPLAMYVNHSDGNVDIVDNWGLNFQWDWNNPVIGFRNGQFIFLETCTGSGNTITGNKIENNFGEAFNEDIINTYGSANWNVLNNKIRGGQGSLSGGGIIGGDQGSVNVLIDGNDLVDPGWYGIQIHASGSGSDNVDVTNNRVFNKTSKPWNSVGFLIYATASGICTNVTMNTTNKGYYIQRNSGPAPNCGCNYPFEYYTAEGTCTGGPFSITQPSEASLEAEMAFPAHLIDCLSEDDYWKLRALKWRAQAVIDSHDDCTSCQDVNARRPDANAGSDQNITITTATLSASSSAIATGGNGTFSLSGYTWVQVSGPNTATMSAATSSTNNLSGLIHGTYVFRLVLQQNNTQFSLKTYDADWITVNVDLS